METRLVKSLRKTLEIVIYLFVFLLPWQTKLILRAGETNFTEVSLYAVHLFLLAIFVAFSFYKLRRRGDGEEKISWLWIALVVWEFFILISFFFATDQVLAFYRYVLVVSGIGLFYIIRDGIRGEEGKDGWLDRGKVLFAFFGGVFLQAIFGISQFLLQSAPGCKYLGLASHSADILGTAVVETSSGRWLRAYGGLDHPNIFGGLLAIALIIAAYFLAQKKMVRSRREMAESLALFVFYFIALIALFFTFSRSAWLALSVGLFACLLAVTCQKDRWITGRFLAVIFFSLFTILIVAVPYRELLQTRVAMTTRLEQKSISERRAYLIQSEGMIKEHWLAGVGAGNYPVVIADKDQHQKAAYDYPPVHNAFLLVWAESGVLALVSFLVFLFLLITKNRRTPFAGAVLAAMVILMLLDHWLISLPFGTLFLFLILGLL